MHKLLFLNSEALIGGLFWCNLFAVVFLAMYWYKSKNVGEKKSIGFLTVAKLFHALAYFCFFGRDILPDWFSVNVGNSVFFLGFYLEAQMFLIIIRGRTKQMVRILTTILAVSLTTFNIIEFLIPRNGLRVSVSSLCVVLIMMLPNIKILKSRDTSHFAKFNAVIHMLFIALLLPRAWYSLVNQDVGILTSTVVQSLTFEALLLLTLLSISAYILITKEYTESALRLMATTDKVTGATNRYAFVEAASAVYDSYINQKKSLAVLFIDIDFFKSINDQFGHAFGDVVLVRLAEIIDQCLKGQGLSCRYGGEEFVVLLENADREAARLFGESIMDGIKKMEFEGKDNFSFTISIGISMVIPSKSHTLDWFIDLADQAMYEAKNNGRNRIVFYNVPEIRSSQIL